MQPQPTSESGSTASKRTLTSFFVLSLSSTFIFTSFLTNGSNIAFCVDGGVYFEAGNNKYFGAAEVGIF
jgi:hypothetical protein